MSATQFRWTTRVHKTPPHSQSWVKRRRSINNFLMALFFIAPGLILFFMFVLFPVAQSARYSLYEWDGFGEPDEYVEFENYEQLYEHRVFRTALENSFSLMGLSIAIQLPFALLLALMIGRGNLPGKRIFRALLFLPFVFSEIIAAIIWSYVYHPQDGLANLLALELVPGAKPTAWLGDPQIVIYSIFAVVTWKFFGLYMILYMAALQNVPKDLEEAARVDGANWLQVISRITLPMMGPTLRLTVYLSVLGSFQQFVLVQVLTRGGNPVNSGHVLSTFLYKFGIQRFRMGDGSAVAVVLFLITLVFSIGYQRIVMRRDFSLDG